MRKTTPSPSGQATPIRQPVGARVCRPTDGRRYLLTPEVWYYGIMATRKITFSLPEALVRQFARQVPPRQRSRYVAEALAWKLKERDRIVARACEIANRSRQARTIEQELDALADPVMEPWDESSSW